MKTRIITLPLCDNALLIPRLVEYRYSAGVFEISD